MAEPMMGQIMAFAGGYNPKDWAYCNGELLPIAEYGALYSIWGTTYGGDGRTSFGLPDLRGRGPLGMGAGPGRMTRVIGSFGGVERVTLITDQMPSHSHELTDVTVSGDISSTLTAYDGQGNSYNPVGGLLAQQGSRAPAETKVYSRTTSPTVNMSTEAVSSSHNLSVTGQNAPTGGGQGHENMAPWLCLNYIISLSGYYPSRT
jgi:microcystin-dependent protein